MNVVAIMGRLTADPEVRQTPNGVSVCSFSIAVDRYTNGEKKADFISCVAWKETADNIARFFRKGNKIGINGSIQTRQYQDRDTGKNRTAFEVLVDRFHFCEKSEQAQTNQYSQPQANKYQPDAGTQPSPQSHFKNIDIHPQQEYVPQQTGFTPSQQGFIPTPPPKFAPQYPAGFEPLRTDEGDMPF